MEILGRDDIDKEPSQKKMTKATMDEKGIMANVERFAPYFPNEFDVFKYCSDAWNKNIPSRCGFFIMKMMEVNISNLFFFQS
jgi:hypothetical protein